MTDQARPVPAPSVRQCSIDPEGALAFCRALPKIELHAHINGCIRDETLNELCRTSDDLEVQKFRVRFLHTRTRNEYWMRPMSQSYGASHVYSSYNLSSSYTAPPMLLLSASHRHVCCWSGSVKGRTDHACSLQLLACSHTRPAVYLSLSTPGAWVRFRYRRLRIAA